MCWRTLPALTRETCRDSERSPAPSLDAIKKNIIIIATIHRHRGAERIAVLLSSSALPPTGARSRTYGLLSGGGEGMCVSRCAYQSFSVTDVVMMMGAIMVFSHFSSIAIIVIMHRGGLRRLHYHHP